MQLARSNGEPPRRVWDVRAAHGGEIAPGDTVVFARGTVDDPPSPYAYDDSA